MTSEPNEEQGRTVPPEAAALIVQRSENGNVQLQLVYPEGAEPGEPSIETLIAKQAMNYVVHISEGDG